MRPGPRHDRGESARLPDDNPILEGIVVDTIDGKIVDNESEPRKITPGKGLIKVFAWRKDEESGKWRLYYTGQTQEIFNFDDNPIETGTYVRCEFFIAWWQPYWQSCATWSLDDLEADEYYEIEEPE